MRHGSPVLELRRAMNDQTCSYSAWNDHDRRDRKKKTAEEMNNARTRSEGSYRRRHAVGVFVISLEASYGSSVHL